MKLYCKHSRVYASERKNAPNTITDLITRERFGKISSRLKSGCLLRTKEITLQSLLGGCTSVAVLGFTRDGEYLVVMDFKQTRLGGKRSVSLQFWPVVLPLWRTLKCLHLIPYHHDKSEEGYAASCVHHPMLSLSLTRTMIDEQEDEGLSHDEGFSLFGGLEEDDIPAVTLLESVDGGDLLVVCSAEGYADESVGHTESVFLCSRGVLCGHERNNTRMYLHRYEIWIYRPCMGYMHSSSSSQLNSGILDNSTAVEYSPICIYTIAVGQHLVCIDAGGHLFFIRTGLKKEKGVKGGGHLEQQQSTDDVELVSTPVDVPLLRKSYGNYCECHSFRQLKGGKWWGTCAMAQKHCFEGDERWSRSTSLDIEELMYELIKPHLGSTVIARVVDYESRLISRPLLHNSSALLAFSVLIQTPLQHRGNHHELQPRRHKRTENVFYSGFIDFVLAVHYVNGNVKVLHEIFEHFPLTSDPITDFTRERAIKLQNKWSTRMSVTSRVLDNYPLLIGESMSRLDNKQLACAIVMD